MEEIIIINVTHVSEEINGRDSDMKKIRIKFIVNTGGQYLFYEMKFSLNCDNLEDDCNIRSTHVAFVIKSEAIVTIIVIQEMVRKYVQLQE